MKRTVALFSLLAVALLLLAGNLWLLTSPRAPDPRLVDISVRSTLYALPSPTALRLEVTRIVTVTRVVEVVATPTLTATPTLAVTQTATPGDGAALRLGDQPVAMAADAGSSLEADAVAEGPAPPPASPCPAGSDRHFDTIPIASAPTDHPDSIHGDLNLWQRGWTPVAATPALVTINGPADGDAPQLSGLFFGSRMPEFTSTWQVYDWNWGCAANGCRGDLLTSPEVQLLGLRAASGEALSIPTRGAEIYAGGFRAMVLYAEPQRLTLGYTREDGVANGYAVHIENLCVDPNLVETYRASNAAGRGSLPALHNGEVVGVAGDGDLLVAVRDRGVFLDPRSRKDWWKGF